MVSHCGIKIAMTIVYLFEVFFTIDVPQLGAIFIIL